VLCDEVTVTEHVHHVVADGELDEATTRNFRVVRTEGNRSVKRDVTHVNQEMVLHVGYRVRSERGVEFRRFTTHGCLDSTADRSAATISARDPLWQG
jgi:hypothetical protein